MENTSLSNIILYLFIGIVLFLIIIIYLLINKSEENKKLKTNFLKLKKSFNDLDEQAKLILRTDLELNKAQGQLDKRLNGLNALQKTSRLVSTSLDENEIMRRIDQSLLTDLGFEKSLIFICDDKKNLRPRINYGYAQDAANFIIGHLQKDAPLLDSLKEGHIYSSINCPAQRKETIGRLFDVDHFVISPILTQNGFIGVVFVGNKSNAALVTEGDEELVSILANQIGQAVENARLFEEVFRSSKGLEAKIQERTLQLESALKAVQEISQTKSEFISAVSHELRTPLTSIKGYAALLMTGKLGEVPEGVRQRLEKINIHSDNLVKLINDLLDISRIESGRVEMNMGKCNLKNMVENVHDLLTPQMKEKNINWRVDFSPSIPEMILDSSQVERIFINLVGNAIKFTPKEGTIMVIATLLSDIVTVEVSDTGIGIKEEDLSKLFSEFYRVDNEINQNVKGTGLGLVLAKKIIEAHKGKIWVTSKVGKGTTFHFTLPVKSPEKTPEPSGVKH